MPIIWAISSKSSLFGRRFITDIGSAISNFPIHTPLDSDHTTCRNLRCFACAVVSNDLASDDAAFFTGRTRQRQEETTM